MRRPSAHTLSPRPLVPFRRGLASVRFRQAG
jgi:hypothetical protein